MKVGLWSRSSGDAEAQVTMELWWRSSGDDETQVTMELCWQISGDDGALVPVFSRQWGGVDDVGSVATGTGEKNRSRKGSPEKNRSRKGSPQFPAAAVER